MKQKIEVGDVPTAAEGQTKPHEPEVSEKVCLRSALSFLQFSLSPRCSLL
jgi:hypothetical protein